MQKNHEKHIANTRFIIRRHDLMASDFIRTSYKIQERYLTNMDTASTEIMITIIKSKEIKVSVLLLSIGISIAIISLLLASFFDMDTDNTLELANTFATSIVGSAATAIAAIEFTKKIE